jgi:hypothetical protein
MISPLSGIWPGLRGPSDMRPETSERLLTFPKVLGRSQTCGGQPDAVALHN